MVNHELREIPRQAPMAVGTGFIVLDAVLRGENITEARFWAGGTCGNVLIALAYLGWDCKPIARLGSDIAGALLIEDLRRWGIDEQFVRADDSKGTPVIVQRIREVDNGAPRHSFSLRCPGCGAWFPRYTPELETVANRAIPYLQNARVFFFDRVSAGALLLARHAAQRGAVVMFEPSSVGQPKPFQQALEVAHIVKYSHERLGGLLTNVQAASPWLIIETQGEAGLRYRWNPHAETITFWSESPAIHVDMVRDTAGAGDWCSAGLLAKLAQYGSDALARTTRQEVADAIRYGQTLAAWNCLFEGARGGMYAVTPDEFLVQVYALAQGAALPQFIYRDFPPCPTTNETIRVCHLGMAPAS